MAVRHLMRESPPDLVLSGINVGANVGHAVLHSGTIGAALTAARHGWRALAVLPADGLATTRAPALGHRRRRIDPRD